LSYRFFGFLPGSYVLHARARVRVNVPSEKKPKTRRTAFEGVRVSAENSERSAVMGRPFPKGQSGNPGGRPKAEGEIRELAQKHGPEALQRLVDLMGSANERVAVAAAQAVLDRAYGRPVQGLQLAAADETCARWVADFHQRITEARQKRIEIEMRARGSREHTPSDPPQPKTQPWPTSSLN
jgi:hypothetical protein